MTFSSRRAGRRSAATVSVVLMVFLSLLAAIGFAPAGPETAEVTRVHHEVVFLVTDAAPPSSCGHDHTGDESPLHGYATASTVTPRLRPAADDACVTVLSVRAGGAHVSAGAPAAVAITLPDADPARLGVLRV
jgi:hypothetical protein